MRTPKQPAFVDALSPRSSAPPVDPDPDPPLVLIRTVASREIIVAASDAAMAKSIRPGMTLGEARAICADVRHSQHEPHRDAVALEALARWMTRFSPVVAIGDRGSGLGVRVSGFEERANVSSSSPKPETREPKPDSHGLYLDLTGCERVFGGLDNIVARVRAVLLRMRIGARLAVAPTPGAAWAIASSPQHDGRIVTTRDELLAVLDGLSPAALRLEDDNGGDDTVRSLHHLGLCTIGQLMRLPRESLPARFGPRVLLRLDQALGRIAEPLVGIEPFSPIQARMDFDGPVASIESLWAIFQQLIGQVVAELARRGRGAREIQVEFFRPYARDGVRTLCRTIRLSRPSRDAVNLFNLIRCATETMEECASLDEEFWGVRVNVSVSERVAEQQIALLEHEQFAGEQELSHLIERLCARLGEEAIVRAEAVESHIPEKAWKSGVGYRVSGVGTAGRTTSRSEPIRHPKPETRNPIRPIRPLHLLRRPIEVRVMVSPSEDRDGRPVAFTDEASIVHRLAHAVGPERIAGRWWVGHDKTRDYFDVESDSPESRGKRFWIFRVMQTGKWYLHGLFE